ncbi:uroporphyrinogen-III synthase [Rhodanobacter sp. A1T4]|uniref:uroporphyrinogen-III synthase n=1 Tax=Rhodanobacter sp. A1T4 TaxID=2723087 RepID=UPI001620A55E|nr:uroporphyrinogen-III synthase [Rhodanobacter sp. A1T4]MBB6248024.1 uroporphyrinogen-III synthase [Rhodanobacter sp. A1T4]
MQRQIPAGGKNLGGRTVVITRPAGTAAALARKIRAHGGMPMLLPGLSLRKVADEASARLGLEKALTDDVLIFTSPAAVRFAAALSTLKTSAITLTVGQSTARALQRHGISAALVPSRQDSEGLLDHPALRDLRDRRVALIGAPGGRGLLGEQLRARGAQLREVHVYQRAAPRLDRRHVDALLQLPVSALVLLSSAEALNHLCHRLPPPALARLFAATAVVSSERLAVAARAAGFGCIAQAASALSADLLDAASRAG